MISKVTVCLTSCNRLDLLKITVDSFLALNTYPLANFIITEDSGNIDMFNAMKSYFKDKAEIIFNPVNLGIYKSIDNMYNMVKTPFIFHCEDDWQFNHGDPNFIQNSIDILEERKDIHRVCVRDNLPQTWFEEPQFTKNNVKFKMFKSLFMDSWCGFSNNPGLRRKEDYISMFPNGYAEHIIYNKPAVLTEYACNIHASKLNYRAASLMPSSCVHIGGGRSTIS